MDTGILFPTNTDPKEPRHKGVAFDRRDWLALLGIFICAAAYAFLHHSIFSTDYSRLPGIGLALSCWAMLLICMDTIGWKKLQWTKQSVFLLICTLLLSGSYAIFANQTLRLLNLPVLAVLFVMSVSGLHEGSPLGAATFIKNIAYAPHSLRDHFLAPFYGLLGLSKFGKSKHFRELLLGICVCVPVIGILLLLLCDADRVFSDKVGQLGNIFDSFDLGMLPWNIIRMLLLTLLLFSFVYGLNHSKNHEDKQRRKIKLPIVTMHTLLIAITILYAVFVYVQIRYLFAGKAIRGLSYAEYARSGFFQLVFVGIITLLIVLYTLCEFPQNKHLRAECGLINLFTMVIIYSAFSRMQLYIQEYGFTLLRALTLWGMLVISMAMIASLVKAAHPTTAIFAPLLVLTICAWLMLNYCNIGARIAQYNISAFQRGKIDELDVYYLETLGVDALEPMERLLQENTLPIELHTEIYNVHRHITRDKPGIYDWCLNDQRAR